MPGNITIFIAYLMRIEINIRPGIPRNTHSGASLPQDDSCLLNQPVSDWTMNTTNHSGARVSAALSCLLNQSVSDRNKKAEIEKNHNKPQLFQNFIKKQLKMPKT